MDAVVRSIGKRKDARNGRNCNKKQMRLKYA